MLYIREIAKIKSIPLYQLADKIGVTKGSLSTILNKGNMTLATLEKIAAGLNVPIEQLFINPQLLPERDTNNMVCPYCHKPIKITIEKVQAKSKE